MYTTEGIILRRTDAGEADALFTIYTKDYGKIKALAQGVKKEGAKLRGHLEPFSLSSVSFVLGKNGERLTHTTLTNFWPNLHANLNKLRAAQHIVTLVDEETMPGERDIPLWELLVASFKELEGGVISDYVVFLKEFQKKLQSCLGYAQS